jgi:hypothetical protein
LCRLGLPAASPGKPPKINSLGTAAQPLVNRLNIFFGIHEWQHLAKSQASVAAILNEINKMTCKNYIIKSSPEAT